MESKKYSLGLDFGTNSVRALLIDLLTGREVTTAVEEYESGEAGVIIDPQDPNLARQNPADYLKAMAKVVRQVVSMAKGEEPDFSPDKVIGIGVDTTGSTPIPVDEKGVPLCFQPEFKDNLNAYAWLWKDHTSFAESAEITELAAREHPEYLAKCGGRYSSEWFFSKILHCLRVDPQVFDAAYSWVECFDYIPGVLTGNLDPLRLKRSRCAAGHKAMYNLDWGGLPEREFLSKLDPKLAQLRARLYKQTYTADEKAGYLSDEWAHKFGLPPGVPVAVGAFDAHLGAVGAGVAPGILVKIIGTSTCDVTVWSNDEPLADIPGLCGIVDGSVLPGYYGLEAGQSAVGDIFNWFVNYIQPGGDKLGSHEALSQKAAALKPGESGLLALDWNNGNRTVLVDQRLTGLILGQTLLTTPEEIYRALIEATAFGALIIINRFEEYGVRIKEVINCGGIAEKNPLVMQIYADILGREMKIARSSQTCALGSAIAGAVAAGEEKGGYATFSEAQARVCRVKDIIFRPQAENHQIYSRLYRLYKDLHDAFGTKEWSGNLFHVMKELLDIRDQQRRGK
ncbi:MAG: ribulokinase [Candidatus Aminicenantes bacterium]|nr:MAG: ribulokinase [Candidatus Aminicenantes bacterium]